MIPDELKAAMDMCETVVEGDWPCQPRPEDVAVFDEHVRTGYPAALEFIVDLLWEQFYAAAHLTDSGDNAGWYDSCCNKDANWTATYLIPLGLLEEKPGGVGRRRFYRPIEKEKTS